MSCSKLALIRSDFFSAAISCIDWTDVFFIVINNGKMFPAKTYILSDNAII